MTHSVYVLCSKNKIAICSKEYASTSCSSACVHLAWLHACLSCKDVNYTHCSTPYVAALALQTLKVPHAHTLA